MSSDYAFGEGRSRSPSSDSEPLRGRNAQARVAPQQNVKDYEDMYFDIVWVERKHENSLPFLLKHYNPEVFFFCKRFADEAFNTP